MVTIVKYIVLWLILLLLAIPFAISLDKVLVYSETSLVPSYAQSYKVKEFVNKYFKDYLNKGIVVVELDVPVSSKTAYKWYEDINKTFEVKTFSVFDAMKFVIKGMEGLRKGLEELDKHLALGLQGYWMLTDLLHQSLSMSFLYASSPSEFNDTFMANMEGTKLAKYLDLAWILYQKFHNNPYNVTETQLLQIACNKLSAKLKSEMAKYYLKELCNCLISKVNENLWENYFGDVGGLRKAMEKYINECKESALLSMENYIMNKFNFTKEAAEIIVKSILDNTTLQEEARRLHVDLYKVAFEILKKKMPDRIKLLVSKDEHSFTINVFNGNLNDVLNKVSGSIVKDKYALGQDYFSEEIRELNIKDAERSQEFSHIFVIAAMAIILGAVAATVVPFFVIAIAIFVSMGIVYLIASRIPIYHLSKTIMITTGLGLGIDYTVYFLSRFKEEYRRTKDLDKSLEKAKHVAGHAILISGTAAALAFASLYLSNTPMLNGMGITVPITVFMTAIATVTLLPDILRLVGTKRWFWWPDKHLPEFTASKRTVLAIAILLIIVAIPSLMFYMNYKGTMNTMVFVPRNSKVYLSLIKFSHEFPAGAWGPIIVIGKFDKKLEGVAVTLTISKNGHTITLVISKYQPFDERTLMLVPKIRRMGYEVGGMPAELYDMRQILESAFWSRVVPFAAIAVIVILLLATRSLSVISAIVGIIMSAAIGTTLSHWVSTTLWNEPLYWVTPFIALIAVLGVGTDYNVFFIVRALRENPESALKHAGIVIIGLAIIMASAYFGMLMAAAVGLKQMGLSLGLTVLIASLFAVFLNAAYFYLKKR